MSSAAEAAWMKAKGAPARSAFIQGYEAGAFDERIRVAGFISVNMATLTDFAGDRVDELIAFMFREMTPDVPADVEIGREPR